MAPAALERSGALDTTYMEVVVMPEDNGCLDAPDAESKADSGRGGKTDTQAPVFDEAADADSEQQTLISTMFLPRMKDVFEAMRAAHTLGLGVTVHNRWVREDLDAEREEWTEVGDWVLDLFTDARHVDG